MTGEWPAGVQEETGDTDPRPVLLAPPPDPGGYFTLAKVFGCRDYYINPATGEERYFHNYMYTMRFMSRTEVIANLVAAWTPDRWAKLARLPKELHDITIELISEDDKALIRRVAGETLGDEVTTVYALKEYQQAKISEMVFAGWERRYGPLTSYDMFTADDLRNKLEPIYRELHLDPQDIETALGETQNLFERWVQPPPPEGWVPVREYLGWEDGGGC